MDGLPEGLVPDYTKDPVMVLRDATRFVIEEAESLVILQRRLTKQQDRSEGLPSWVPRWYSAVQHEDAGGLPGRYKACGSWGTTELLFHPHPDVLRLKGIVVDRIKEATRDALTLEMSGNVTSLLRHLRSIEAVAGATGEGPSGIGKTVLGATWFTGEEVSETHASAWTQFVLFISSQLEHPQHPSKPSVSNDGSEILAAGFSSSFAFSYIGRRFFSTTSGRIGIGPADLQTGDVLAVLQGGQLPFVLRERGDDFTLLGPTYTLGIMNGEAIEAWTGRDSDPSGVTIFDIR